MKKFLGLGLFLALIFSSFLVHAEIIGDNYPYKESCAGCHNRIFGDNHNDVSEWNFYYRQCTDFVAWRLNSANGVNFTNQYLGASAWGNAVAWQNTARDKGITVDMTPAIGAVAFYGAYEFGSYSTGHVMWVADINDNDTIVIEEYNYTIPSCYSVRTIPANSVSGYIHIADLNQTAPAPEPEPDFTIPETGESVQIFKSGTCENVNWSIDMNGNMTISGVGEIHNFTMGEYNRKSFWKEYGKYVRTLTVEEGITHIGEDAFSDFTILKTVNLPSTLKTIGVAAFGRCASLTDINFPEGLEQIDRQAFKACSSLVSVTLPNTVELLAGAFMDCKNLQHINLPNALESYNARVFANCPRLLIAELPASLTKIIDNAFEYTNIGTEMVIPNTVTYIGQGAFSRSTVEKVFIPASVTEIRHNAFKYAFRLKEIEVDPNNPKFYSKDGVLFSKDTDELCAYPNGNPQTSYEIPEGVWGLCHEAFMGSQYLEYVKCPTTLGFINTYAFQNLPVLRKLTFQNGLGQLSISTFADCPQLESVTFGHTIYDLGSEANENSPHLTDYYFNGTEEEWAKVNTSLSPKLPKYIHCYRFMHVNIFGEQIILPGEVINGKYSGTICVFFYDENGKITELRSRQPADDIDFDLNSTNKQRTYKIFYIGSQGAFEYEPRSESDKNWDHFFS